VTFMDDAVGQILAALDASGQRDDTLTVYTSDHGEMLGDHGLWTKQVMYDASAGVPLVLSGPGVAVGEPCATPVSLLDLAPTIRSAAQVSDRAGPGEDLRALAMQSKDEARTVFSEYHDGGSTTGAFMVRWSRWKYVYYPGKPPQLFDLLDDPDELSDLGTTDALEGVRREGLNRLRAICDPEEINARAFADQRRRIEELGGEAVLREAKTFNHTPTP
jgi:choline-sulfatase